MGTRQVERTFAWGLRLVVVIGVVAAALLVVAIKPVLAAPPMNVEAETMKRLSGSGGVYFDSTASNDRAVLRATEGAVSKTLSIAPIERVVVRARGNSCKGAPIMQLRVDGVHRKSWRVPRGQWTDYSAYIANSSGSRHTVTVSYSNEFRKSRQCDRNLRVDRVTLVPSLTAGSPPYDVDKSACDGSLQDMIKAAPSGGVVQAPGGCVYREAVFVGKPLTLKGEPGAEIRGSEVWAGWTRVGAYWVSEDSVPDLPIHGQCEEGTGRCLWPEQVFLDGRQLSQVSSAPQSGQFSVTQGRRVVLADDPRDRTAEVTVRKNWLVGGSAGVTVEGFTMRHAANDSQRYAAITNGGYSDWTVRGNTLSDAHGAVVSLAEGTGLQLLGNDISRGGQLGVHSSRADLLIQDNEIHHNNTEAFAAGWEAGGVKTSAMRSLVATGNRVYDNAGTGFWCDVGCENATYSYNRIHHNSRMGINFEISSGGRVFGNALWENGWGFSGWGWGGGIVLSSSKNVEVHDNTVAWNADGISVISANRDVGEAGTDFDDVTDVRVYDNHVVVGRRSLDAHEYSLAWLDQKETETITDAGSGNTGSDNRYWHGETEDTRPRYSWGSDHLSRLSSFNVTPGEENGRYLGDDEKTATLSSADVPASPEPHS